ncbi:thiaminase II [Spirillospora sp. NPDC047279]|uniref:thiaminase II n=1 Tax=Spirillospora sp. NPDC047279 TaxID=3155478 RepID=UPI0033C479B2
MSFTAWLWDASAGIYEQIRLHPFLQGLTTGKLDRDAFRFYVIQDSHYLKDYARTLDLVAAKAPTPAEATLFAEHATNAAAVEQTLHATFLAELGDVTEPPAPTTVAYTNFLLASAYAGSFGEAVAAVLPCYWIYAKVGEELLTASSPDPLYARWIATYAAPDFQRLVTSVLEITERHAATLSPSDHERMRQRFITAARYEWMFWDAAYRQQRWPVSPEHY